MLQFFRKRASDDAPNIDAELADLESQLKSAAPGYETTILNRAGDLCAKSNRTEQAVAYYGRAIDMLLDSGRHEAAEALCRKVLRTAPNTVRVRSTLAWISLGRGHLEDARRALREYVYVAVEAHQEHLAIKQVVMMADAVDDPNLREMLAELLLDLGNDEAANTVFGAVFAERNGLRPAAETHPAELWSKLLRAALMTGQELEAYDPAAETQARLALAS